MLNPRPAAVQRHFNQHENLSEPPCSATAFSLTQILPRAVTKTIEKQKEPSNQRSATT
jgi:hypothetical protein